MVRVFGFLYVRFEQHRRTDRTGASRTRAASVVPDPTLEITNRILHHQSSNSRWRVTHGEVLPTVYMPAKAHYPLAGSWGRVVEPNLTPNSSLDITQWVPACVGPTQV